jgi:hypothetical protein
MSWKTLSRRTVLSQSPWLEVEYHQVELPNGRLIPDWPWIKTPDYINVLPETGQGNFLLFRQGKYGLEGSSLAPVGGYIQPGEPPLAAAQRELGRRPQRRNADLAVFWLTKPRRSYRTPYLAASIWCKPFFR